MEDLDSIMLENETFHKNSSCEMYISTVFDQKMLDEMEKIKELDENERLLNYLKSYNPNIPIKLKIDRLDSYAIMMCYENELKIKYNIDEMPKTYFLKHYPNIMASMGIICMFVKNFHKQMTIPDFSMFSIYEFIVYRTNLYKMIDILFQIQCNEIVINDEHYSIFKLLDDIGKYIVPFTDKCINYKLWNNFDVIHKIDNLIEIIVSTLGEEQFITFVKKN